MEGAAILQSNLDCRILRLDSHGCSTPTSSKQPESAELLRRPSVHADVSVLTVSEVILRNHAFVYSASSARPKALRRVAKGELLYFKARMHAHGAACEQILECAHNTSCSLYVLLMFTTLYLLRHMHTYTRTGVAGVVTGCAALGERLQRFPSLRVESSRL